MKILSLILGVIHAVSALVLLVFSAWFIAASAIAGIDYATAAFNYMLPAVIIRALALTRIASGYSQMWTGHHALLNRVKTLRLQLFSQLKNKKMRRRAEGTEALAKHAETLAAISMASTIHTLSTCVLFIMTTGIIATYLADYLPLWLIFWLCLLLILYRGNRAIFQDSHDILQTKTQFRHDSEHHLNSASLWHLRPQIKHPNMQMIYQRIEQQRGHAERMLWQLELLALVLLLVILTQDHYRGQAVLMIILLLLLAAKDWLAPLIHAQSARADYRESQHSFTELPLQNITAATIQPEPIKTLRLHNFKAQDRPAVNPINLTIKHGEIILLKGDSGSGKTTILKAVAGLLPHQGEKIVNQQTITAGFINKWHYAAQTPVVLSASLAANLRLAGAYHDEITDENKLRQALAFADLAHLDNLSEWLGEQGRRLSGGELKRLNIARAYLFPAELYLFDEPFEGLDNAQQQRLANAIQTLSSRAPILIASHIVPPNLQRQQTLLIGR